MRLSLQKSWSHYLHQYLSVYYKKKVKFQIIQKIVFVTLLSTTSLLPVLNNSYLQRHCRPCFRPNPFNVLWHILQYAGLLKCFWRHYKEETNTKHLDGWVERRNFKWKKKKQQQQQFTWCWPSSRICCKMTK